MKLLWYFPSLSFKDISDLKVTTFTADISQYKAFINMHLPILGFNNCWKNKEKVKQVCYEIRNSFSSTQCDNDISFIWKFFPKWFQCHLVKNVLFVRHAECLPSIIESNLGSYYCKVCVFEVSGRKVGSDGAWNSI